MRQQLFPRVELQREHLLIRDQVMDTIMTDPADPQALGPHLFPGEQLLEPLLAVDVSGDQVMEREEALTTAEVAGVGPGAGIVVRVHGKIVTPSQDAGPRGNSPCMTGR